MYVPFDLTNYGCGILKIKWSQYALATVIGIIPGAAAFVSFGTSIKNIDKFDLSQITLDTSQLVISVVIFVASLALARIVRRYNLNKK